MTVSRPCYFGNLLLGVVGVDVNLAYILEDVTYYQDSLASYTFLIDDKGGLFAGCHSCAGNTGGLTHVRNLKDGVEGSVALTVSFTRLLQLAYF